MSLFDLFSSKPKKPQNASDSNKEKSRTNASVASGNTANNRAVRQRTQAQTTTGAVRENAGRTRVPTRSPSRTTNGTEQTQGGRQTQGRTSTTRQTGQQAQRQQVGVGANGRGTTRQNTGRTAQGSTTKPKETVTQKKKTKSEGPVLTKEEVKNLLLALLASVLLCAVILGLLYGIVYAVSHIRFDFGYDIKVVLDDGSEKPSSYETDSDAVFRDPGGQPYISLTRLADSLGLSSVGDGNKIRFYMTTDRSQYVSMTHGSPYAEMNGEKIALSSPVYITDGATYVPISFFEYYTEGVMVYYDPSNETMTVEYKINEELSTPKRKVLEDFVLLVKTPVYLEEMTEEEWFEYVGNRSKE